MYKSYVLKTTFEHKNFKDKEVVYYSIYDSGSKPEHFVAGLNRALKDSLVEKNLASYITNKILSKKDEYRFALTKDEEIKWYGAPLSSNISYVKNYIYLSKLLSIKSIEVLELHPINLSFSIKKDKFKDLKVSNLIHSCSFYNDYFNKEKNIFEPKVIQFLNNVSFLNLLTESNNDYNFLPFYLNDELHYQIDGFFSFKKDYYSITLSLTSPKKETHIDYYRVSNFKFIWDNDDLSKLDVPKLKKIELNDLEQHKLNPELEF